MLLDLIDGSKEFSALMNISTPWYKTKWQRLRNTSAIAESTMRIAYNKVQIKCTLFHKSLVLYWKLVLKRLRISPGSRSLPRTSTSHAHTMITLEPINSCPVALLSPKGFGRGLARPLAHPPRRFARVMLLMRFICHRHFVLYHEVEMFIRTKFSFNVGF